jgi:hypothetical protein
VSIFETYLPFRSLISCIRLSRLLACVGFWDGRSSRCFILVNWGQDYFNLPLSLNIAIVRELGFIWSRPTSLRVYAYDRLMIILDPIEIGPSH